MVVDEKKMKKLRKKVYSFATDCVLYGRGEFKKNKLPSAQSFFLFLKTFCCQQVEETLKICEQILDLPDGKECFKNYIAQEKMTPEHGSKGFGGNEI